MVIAIVALIAATTGSAVAASSLITSAKIKNGTIRLADISSSTQKSLKKGTAGPKGEKGDKGDTGTAGAAGVAGPGARWALINADHTAILAQSGGISIATTSGAGVYLDMGADVAGKAVQATRAYLDSDGGSSGSVQATICGGLPYGGHCGPAGTDDTRHAWVFTQNAANNAGENHAVYVSVF
jgi:hypothetical protein